MSPVFKIAAPLVAVVFALSGCSAPSTTVASPTPIASPAAPVVKAGDEVPSDTLISSLGAASKQVKTMSFTSEVTTAVSGQNMTMKLSAKVDQTDPKNLKMAITMDAPTGAMEMVISGDDYFMKIGETWYKTTKQGLETKGQKMPDLSAQTDVTSALAGKVKKAVYVGEETIDGTPTKHFRLTLDPSAFGGTTATPSLDGVAYDLWIDASNLTRKYSMKVDSSSGAVSTSGTMSKINETVTVTIPTNAKDLPS